MSEVTFDFSGKNFAVVGASSGIGRQIAIELAESGANILAVARRENRLEELKQAFPERISIKSLDVENADNNEWQLCFEDFVKVHGKFDGGVSTAGVSIITPLKSFDRESAEKIMNTGFYGSVNFLHNLCKKKFTNENASFVLFSSTSSYDGPKGMTAYAASKAAIRIAVKVIAKEIVGRGQRINSISPGWTDTEMTQNSIVSHIGGHGELGIGSPEDLSGMTLFLLSNRAKWITGKDFIIDGGLL